MEIKIKGVNNFAFLKEKVFVIIDYPKIGWGYVTANADEAKAYGFGVITSGCGTKLNFLAIKDIAHTRGFESNVYCKYKGFEFFVHSYNVCNDKLFCISPESYEAAKIFGFSDGAMRYEMPNLDVPLSDLDEIYRKRRRLDKFIFDVDPIKPIYKDGKWLIEPDENGVYVI